MQTRSKTILSRYQYDALDRLVNCTLSEHPGTQRFYQKNRLTTEMNGSVHRSIMQHDDQLLAQQQRQTDAVETSLLATDQQRSVFNSLDASGPRPISHTPYGHRPLASGLLSLLGFNGERPDPVTGCYLLGNGYRAFNPVLMRFNRADSWSPFGEGGLNAYAYCLNDPINGTDTAGHAPRFLNSLLSFFTGSKTLTRSRMEGLTIMADDAYFHFDKVGKLRRLNISAHGNPSSADDSYSIVIGNKTYTPEQLHTALANKGIQYDTSRLIFCFSASGEQSFAQKFANVSKKPSTGFTELVSSSQLAQDVMSRYKHFKNTHPSNPEKHLNKYYSNKTHRIYKLRKPSKMVTYHPNNTTSTGTLADTTERIRS